VTETDETSGVLAEMAAVRGRPDELAALLAIVQRERAAAQDGAPAAADPADAGRTAVRTLLRERLRHLLAAAQRDIEDLLTRADRRPVTRAANADADAGQDAAGVRPFIVGGTSGAGAYLATASTIHRGAPSDGATAAPPISGARREPDSEPDLPLATADIGELTAQIVEIQKGLSAL
jgi:hypothetical protein